MSIAKEIKNIAVLVIKYFLLSLLLAMSLSVILYLIHKMLYVI